MSERALTRGEIELAKRVFKDAIDYDKVKVHDKKYVFVQPDNCGMTPNGEIYVSGSAYKNDYSMENSRFRAFFIHEMVHVWQYQLKVLRPISAAIAESFRHGFIYSKAYDYELQAGKDLLKYRIEQQAQIIQDYYLLQLEATAPRSAHRKNGGSAAENMALYFQVLAKFLADPAYDRQVAHCNRDTYGPPGAADLPGKREPTP